MDAPYRVLLTGAPGFIGSHFVEAILNTTNWTIVGLDRLDETSTLARISETTAFQKHRNRFKFVWHDLKSPINDFVSNEIGEINIVLHLAASTHVDRSIVDPMSFVLDNVVGTCNLLEWARKNTGQLYKFIHFSTDEVFGSAPEDVFFKESDRFNSGNPYCLAANSVIPLADGTEQEIGVMKPNSILSFDFSANSVVTSLPTERLKFKTSKQLLRIETDRFVHIDCTAEHKFFVKRPGRWRSGRLKTPDWLLKSPMTEMPAAEIQPGDYLATSRVIPAPLSKPFTSIPIARLMGYFMGDGYVETSQNNYIELAEGDLGLANCYAAIVRLALTGWNDGATPQPGINKHSTKNCWYIQFGCQKFRKLLIDHRLNAYAAEKCIPPEIMGATDEEVKQFLAGYYDADGSSSDHTITYGSASRKLLEQTEHLLRRFGILASLTVSKSKKKKNPFYKLTISDYKSLSNARKHIPVFKFFNLGVFGKAQHINADADLVWTRVERVGPVANPASVVYDFDVPPLRNYLAAGGIIVHNSASKAGAVEFCSAYGNTYNIPIISTFCMNVIAERQNSEKFLPKIIGQILKGETVTIHADPTRTLPAKRTYIHARNVWNAVEFLIRKGRAGERYNIVGDRELDCLELAHKVANILHKPLKFEIVDFHSSRPGHDLRYALDGAKLRELGFSQPVAFEASLAKTVKWYVKNPKWLGL